LNAADLITDFYNSHPAAIRSCLKAMETTEEYPPCLSQSSSAFLTNTPPQENHNNQLLKHTNQATSPNGLTKEMPFKKNTTSITPTKIPDIIQQASNLLKQRKEKKSRKAHDLYDHFQNAKQRQRKSQNLKQVKEEFLKSMIKDFIVLDNQWK